MHRTLYLAYRRHKFLKRCRCHRGRPTVDNFGPPRPRHSRLAPTICGRTCRRRLGGHPAVLVMQFRKHLFHRFQRHLEEIGKETQFNSFIFRQTPIVIYVNAQQSRRLCGILKVDKTGHRKPHNFGILSQRITKISFQRYGSGTRFGYSLDTQLSAQRQSCIRYEEKFAAILRKHAWSDLH